MRKHRILLLSTHPLLSEGLQNLLGKKEDLTLIGPHALDEPIITGLAAYAPDVILVAGQADDDCAAGLILQLLQRYPELPVIQIDLAAGSTVRVYTSHALPARSAELFDVIRSLPAQGSQGEDT